MSECAWSDRSRWAPTSLERNEGGLNTRRRLDGRAAMDANNVRARRERNSNVARTQHAIAGGTPVGTVLLRMFLVCVVCVCCPEPIVLQLRIGCFLFGRVTYAQAKRVGRASAAEVGCLSILTQQTGSLRTSDKRP